MPKSTSVVRMFLTCTQHPSKGVGSTLGLSVISPFLALNEVAKINNEPDLGGDPRIEVLSELQDAVAALAAFNKAAATGVAGE